MDEPGRDRGAGHVGDQLPAPLDRHVLEDHQVDGQGAQVRADGDRRVRHPRRAGRQVLAAAAAQPACRSCWIRCADGSGISSCWNDRATPRSAAPARSAPHSHVPRAGNDQESHRAPPSSSPIPAPPAACRGLRFAARSAARRCLRGGLRPGGVITARAASRNSRCYGTGHAPAGRPAPAAPPPRRLRPQARDLCTQSSDLSIPGSAAIATRGRRGQIGHEP